MTITFPVAHHYCIVDAAVHGQEIFKTMIHFPNHGRSEGEREATLKIARTMLQSGIDRNTVMGMTGLTEEDLQHITH